MRVVRFNSQPLPVGRRLAPTVLASALMAIASWAFAAAPGLAYTGPFCSNVNLAQLLGVLVPIVS